QRINSLLQDRRSREALQILKRSVRESVGGNEMEQARLLARSAAREARGSYGRGPHEDEAAREAAFTVVHALASAASLDPHEIIQGAILVATTATDAIVHHALKDT